MKTFNQQLVEPDPDVMAEKQLNVLFIEDQVQDLQLSVDVLRKAGFNFKFERVETEKEFNTYLQDHTFDIALCDKHLPGWDAKEAIQKIREHTADAPVILLSGSTSHEEALKHLQDGASDYLLKDHLVRLPFAVRRALQEQAERKTRVEVEKKLRDNESRYRALVESSYDALVVLDQAGKFIYISKAYERITGYTAMELLNTDRLILIHFPEDLEKARDSFDESLKNPGKPVSVLVRMRRKDGETIWLDIVRTNCLDNESVRGIVCNIRDVTIEKNAIEKIRINEAKLRSLVENSNDGLVLLDKNGRIFYTSDATARITGCTVNELLTSDRNKNVHPDDVSKSDQALRDSMGKSGVPVTVQLRSKRGNKSWGWLELVFTNHLDDPNVKGIVCNVRDITDQKLASDLISQQEWQFRTLVENAPFGIYRFTNNSNHFLTVNPALVSMLGYSSAKELLNARLFEDIYVEAETRTKTLDQSKGKDTYTSVVHWKQKNGSEITVRLVGARIHSTQEKDNYHVVFAENISDQIQLEKQLKQSQKMEAVGMLAGGIAHDFNNLLGIILGQSELIMEKFNENDPLKKRVLEISKAGIRAATLTRQLLIFSRKEKVEMRFVDLNHVVKECQKLLERLIGENIQLKFELYPEPLRINADPGQIGQIIMNLVINARDAISKTGAISIKTSKFNSDGTNPIGLPTGEYAQFEVHDTGAGMSTEVKGQIFEPFFTTKKEMGTGLGLSTSYGIVQQHHGYIHVESETGVGTTFTVTLPLKQSATPEIETVMSVEPMKGKNETILLVEDEPAFRVLLKEMLEERGYNVLQAHHGAAALEMSDLFEEHIHLLITDVIMPEMNGVDLVERIKIKRPGLRVLFISGYTDDMLKRHSPQMEGAPLLMKPFTPLSLAVKVREVLDAK